MGEKSGRRTHKVPNRRDEDSVDDGEDGEPSPGDLLDSQRRKHDDNEVAVRAKRQRRKRMRAVDGEN